MVRLTSSRTIASVLLLCVAVQAHPAARLHMRQDTTATSTELDPAVTDPATATDEGEAIPSGTEAETPTTGIEDPLASPTEEVTSSETSTEETSETDTAEATPTEESESSTTTETESTTSGPATPSVWISVNETDGRISTITPSVTEIDGVTSTVNNPDPDHTGGTDPGEDEPTSFLPTCDESKYQGGGKYAPFCLPNNSTHLWFKNTYYVTWDPTYWGDDEGNNQTVEITANYQNDSAHPQRGLVAFDSGVTPLSLGFITFYVDPDKYEDGAVIHWTMKRIGVLANTEKSFRSGPWVAISNEPVTHAMPSERPPVSTVGLAVGLPLAALFIVGVIGILHFCNKDKRSIRGIVIPSMRRRRAEAGYGSRKSRTQRAGPPAYRDDVDARAAAWEMGNIKVPETPRSPPGPYHDDPAAGEIGLRRDRPGAENAPQNPFSDRYEGK
ncbi:hypothetical protein ABW19_dt0203311 [Dactylella cylindrospora]|nr:hypothetical protein ABW19_dt0203311 [Dactylella cylindrospora]